MQNLKLLMSAYACEPDKGSEPGIGWRWALETAALGHDVWIITRANNEAGIVRGMARLEAARHEDARAGITRPGLSSRLHFIYFDLPPWARWWKRGGRGVHLYYLLWQWGAHLRALELHATQHFDAVQHITFGVLRHPSFMGRLGIPFIAGPLGGGEQAPVALRKYYSTAGKIRDRLRDVANVLARFDPWLRQMYQQASLILMKTPQSLNWLPTEYRHKARCLLEIGVDPRPAPPEPLKAKPRHHQTLHVLYVGRFDFFKGMDLGLRAIAEVHARSIPVRLTMIGQGPARKRWQQLTAQLQLADRVTWVPWMKQPDLLQAYHSFDVLLFPSMHDSSGNVLLESMASGLPVVCMDLGGPAEIIDASCGRSVAIAGLDADQAVQALADALAELASDPALRLELRAGALQRAGDFSWRQVVGQVWGDRGYGQQAIGNPAKERDVYVSA